MTIMMMKMKMTMMTIIITSRKRQRSEKTRMSIYVCIIVFHSCVTASSVVLSCKIPVVLRPVMNTAKYTCSLSVNSHRFSGQELIDAANIYEFNFFDF
jgi:hypothetical protein